MRYVGWRSVDESVLVGGAVRMRSVYGVVAVW